jgi:ABC-2 type transport system permease protein
MKPLLRAELIKLRTTRTFAGLAGTAVGLSLLVTALVSILTEPTEDSVLIDVYATDASGLFIVVLAVIGIAGEWRHRTITSSLLAAPERVRFLAAKGLAFAAAGAVLSVLIMAAVAALGTAILAFRDLPLPDGGELLAQVGRNVVVAMLLGALGVAVGALVRNQVIAVVGLLMVWFVVEPTLLSLAPSVGKFGPFVALSTGASGIPAEDAQLGDVALLAPGVAGLLLLAWIAVAFAASAALLRPRDLH